MSEWYLRTQDDTFGPESEAKLIEWARMGRIQPGQEVSNDNEIWQRVEDVPFLDMRYSIDLGDGNPRGPYNRRAAEALLASGRLPSTATMVETRPPFPTSAESESADVVSPEEPVPVGEGVKIVEKIVEKVVEVPVEKIVEKVVEVPVEKIVEKEVRVEVPVEKIVEVEKIVNVPIEKEVIKEVEKIVEVPVEREVIKEVEKVVVDDRRIRELEASLAEAESSLAAQKRQLAEAESARAEQAERIAALEEELKRLPQTASEIADTQAAVYSIMTGEAEELAGIIEAEKREAEEFRKRHQERTDRMLERRRELLRRAGENAEGMTRRALVEHPEDPRTAQLRKDMEELRRISERKAVEAERTIRDLTEQVRMHRAELARNAEGAKDVSQLRAEIESLRGQLQVREKDLMAERQNSDNLRKQQALSQQALMARLASLESPSIGTSDTLSTNQSREAKQVKLPSWMRLGK